MDHRARATSSDQSAAHQDNGVGKVDGLITASGATNTFTLGAGDTLTAAGGLALTGGKLGGTGTLLGNLTDTSSVSFTYKDTLAGTPTITAGSTRSPRPNRRR